MNLSKIFKNISIFTQESLFRQIHKHHLVYNTSWEDPELDRQLLQINADSKIVMLTSAGDNALEYLLDNPKKIYSVDINPRQNSLLELKIRLIEKGCYENLYMLFGSGSHPKYNDIFKHVLPTLSPYAKKFWKQKKKWFQPNSFFGSFYYHGTCGQIAWFISHILKWLQPNFYARVLALLEAESIEKQRELFAELKSKKILKFLCWVFQHPASLAMLGVPHRQSNVIAKKYRGGLSAYVRDLVENLGENILFKENYFWRVYLTGSYSPVCLPNYLREKYFKILQDRIKNLHLYDSSLTQFLRENPGSYTHFILLDHQDWMASQDNHLLCEEWAAILENSADNARVLFRSSSFEPDFLPDFVYQHVTFHPELTKDMLKKDRAGTYGSINLGIIKK